MTTPAVYWPWRSPLAEMMALTGPVRQVGTAPTKAETMLEAPHPAAIWSTGGVWPAAVSTAMPWPFCTTRTVMARGTTSSAIAANEKEGTWRSGAASQLASSRAGEKVPHW